MNAGLSPKGTRFVSVACFEECHCWIIYVGVHEFVFAVSLCSDGNSLVIAMTTKTSRQPSNISDDRRCVGEYQPLPACQFIIPLHFPPKQSSLHIKVARDIKCGRLISAAQACGAGKPLMFLGGPGSLCVWPSLCKVTCTVLGCLCGRKWSTCSCFLYLNEKAEAWKAFVSQTQICSTNAAAPLIPEVLTERGRC